MTAERFDHVRMLLIDNYDSFTYNLVQAFAAQGADVIVHRNDEITVDEALALEPTHLVISPGPGNPDDAGVSLDMIAAFEQKIPVLGVCLGHQCIGEVFGGTVARSKTPLYGQSSFISHDRSELFEHLSQPLEVGLYHSLIVDETPNLLEQVQITARSPSGEIMAIQHKSFPIYGVQFHPESILTPQGYEIIGNFLALTKEPQHV